MLPMRRDGIRDQRAFNHRRKALQISEARRAHVNAPGMRSSVAHHVVRDLPARRFHGLIRFAGGHAITLGDNLEMVDERFHLRLHLLAVGQHDMRRVGLPRALGHPFQRLFHDARALAHLFYSHLEPRVHVVSVAHGDLEIEFFVGRIRLGLADVPRDAGRRAAWAR